MAEALVGLIDRTENDEGVRSIVITGEGRAFCAGADLSAASGMFGEAPQPHSEEPFRDFGGIITLRIYDCMKPVIVAFNGPAAGMGVTLALAADIRLASSTAKFALPFVRRGIVPESASSWFLPRIVGLPTALDWVLAGKTVSVDEALTAGLVRSVHPPDRLMEATLAICEEIARETSPVSVAMSRRLLWRMAGETSPHRAHDLESRLLERRRTSQDLKEGVASFIEKRSPCFPDSLADELPDESWWQ